MPFKQNFLTVCFYSVLIFFLVIGCGRVSVNHWSELVPESTLYIIVPEENTTVEEMLSAPYMPMFDDISPSAIQLVSNIHENSPSAIAVDALLLYPDTANDWQPVWVSKKVDGLIEQLTDLFQLEYEQNRYDFLGQTIEKLFFSDRIIFILNVGDYTIFSESSLAIENILRTVRGANQPVALSAEQVTPGSIIFNTESLDLWAKQVAQVTYRPFLTGIFDGAGPISFQFDASEGQDWDWQMRGNMQIGNNRSTLLRSITGEPSRFILDRYIPVNAAAFAIFRTEPGEIPFDESEPTLEADQYIYSNQQVLQPIRQNIGREIAFVSFAESGPASTSEYVYLRTIQNPDLIRMVLDNLANRNLAIKNENTYFLNSSYLSKLLGSGFYPVDDFYITVYDRVIAIAQRNGLAESIGGDAERRRVMYYDDDYSKVLNSFNEPLSSIFYMDASRFGRFIQPWLYPQNYMSSLLNNMDEFVITTRRRSNEPEVDVKFTNFERERTERPFREQWVFPLGGADISGQPVIADITGSARDEVVFSTETGSVYVLASDGTTVFQMNTNDGDAPVGSPVVYDWYGNNQNVIMQAAGDKVYAWNRNGTMLPNFPVQLNETVTTPLTVMDITGNGVAEMILATGDRQIHILNARGQAISGWPQSTNSVVQSRPLITEIGGVRSLFAFAENTLHAWNINGQRRDDYPVFLSAQMHGSPIRFENHILGAGLDGSLYAVGREPLFDQTLSTSNRTNSLHIQSLTVSNSSLNATPSIHSVLLRHDDGEFERDDLILLQSGNGSIFLYSRTGELKFTQSLGQPASGEHPPVVVDINNDQREDIVALADYGRFYAWDILSSDRHRELPTSGMSYPVIRDFLGDGNKEIIAQTRDGLQCWTIYFTRREASE